jgi:hypothetical protein
MYDQIVHGLGVGGHCDGLDRAERAVQRDDFRSEGQLARVDPLAVGGVEGVFTSFTGRLEGDCTSEAARAGQADSVPVWLSAQLCRTTPPSLSSSRPN